MNDTIRALLSEFKAGLEVIYGQRLKGIYLYGSYARGEEDSESDIDVLVILEHFDHYGAEVDQTSHLVSALSLKYGVSMSRFFVSQRDWSERETPFLANVREEAIPA
jgi:predicted nucleotidyltransferase